jgi:hypothetical protein
MKKFLYRMVLPAVVLAVVYHYGYSAGRSAGVRTSSVMPQITSAPVSVPPAPITAEARQPKIVETPDVPPPTAKVFRSKSESLGVGKGSEPRLAPPLAAPSAPITPATRQPKMVAVSPDQSSTVKGVRPTLEVSGVVKGSVPALTSVSRSDKAVFRSPNVSGSGTSESERQLSALHPLKAQLYWSRFKIRQPQSVKVCFSIGKRVAIAEI